MKIKFEIKVILKLRISYKYFSQVIFHPQITEDFMIRYFPNELSNKSSCMSPPFEKAYKNLKDF